MNDIFLKIVNMSLSAGWVVLAVLLLRVLFKKAPKWLTVLLWGIVAIRLICPFSIESVLSLIPSAETVSPDIMMDPIPSIDTGVPIINEVVNPIIGGSFTPDPGVSANPLQIWIPLFAIVWIAGMVGMALYTVVSCLRVKRRICTAIRLRDNIYQSETVVSPFVFGIFNPKIYLPLSMNEQERAHVIAHEQAHIFRKDHWWKPFGFALLAIYWFNPLLWLGYVLLCRDIELACDEKVVKAFDDEQKADYSQALLSCSVSRRVIAVCPIAFGEVGVKDRVKSVLYYKKPAFWISIVAVVMCIVTAVCFLTNPLSDTELKNRSFGVEKWYFEYMIGEDRANKEDMNWQIQIDDAGTVTFLVGNESTWVERGTLEPIADPSIWEMVKEKLPFYYRHLNIRQAYAAIDTDNGNATTLFVTKNNLIFYAYIPSYSTDDMYVNEVCKIKKIATLVPLEDVGQAPDNSESEPAHTSGKRTTSTQTGTTTNRSSSTTTIPSQPSSRPSGTQPQNQFHQMYDVVLSYANWTGNDKIYINSLNSSKMQSNNLQHLPVYKFDTVEDLQRFKTTFGDLLTTDRGWDEVPSFNNATAKYGKEFFAENSLLLIYIPTSTCTYRYDLGDIRWNGNSVYIHVIETTDAKVVDNLMGGWFLTIAVVNETLAKCTQFDASFASSVTTKPSSSTTTTNTTTTTEAAFVNHMKQVSTMLDRELGTYALYDMNQDGTPELLYWSEFHLVVCVYRDGVVEELETAGFNAMNGPIKILENGAILSEHVSTGTEYCYETLRSDNTVTRLYFSRNDFVDPLYEFDNEPVSKDEWDRLTKPYFEIPEAKIKWKALAK